MHLLFAMAIFILPMIMGSYVINQAKLQLIY